MKIRFLLATALLFAAANSHAALIHQYDLNGSLADNKGGKSLVSLGGTLGANDYSFSANKGLQLDYALGGVYSIDMMFRLDKLTGYSRILDFKRGASDNGLYATNDKFVLYPVVDYGGDLDVGVFAHVTLTRDAQQQFKIYQDGELVLNVADTGGAALFDGNLAYFFRDNGGDASTGVVDFINIYDHALSQAEVNVLNGGVEVPEPGSMGLIGAGLALVGWTRRRRARNAG